MCRYKGLEKRHLVPLDPLFGPIWSRYESHVDEVTLRGQATLQQIRDNLPEVLHQLTRPLYESFNFYELPLSDAQKAVNDLRRTS